MQSTAAVDRYSTRGVDLPKSEAQSRSIEMVKAYAEADQVGAGVVSRGFGHDLKMFGHATNFGSMVDCWTD